MNEIVVRDYTILEFMKTMEYLVVVLTSFYNEKFFTNAILIMSEI